jgi:hypothetical protein
MTRLRTAFGDKSLLVALLRNTYWSPLMGALIPLALALAPEIGRWLFGEEAEKTTAAVSQAVEAVTGSADADTAAAVLQKSPAAAAQLRLQLAEIASDRETASRRADLEKLTATLSATADARLQNVAVASSQKPVIAWSAPVISAVVLLTFGGVMVIVLLFGMPTGSETAANMLLGTLAAMATSVVSYWVGSSAGSARKDDRLAQSGK